MATPTKLNRDKDSKAAGRPLQPTSDSFWNSSAPAGATGDWEVWSGYLDQRSAPQPLAALCHSSSTPLAWGLAVETLSPQTGALLSLLDQLAPPAAQGKSRVSRATLESTLGGWRESMPQVLTTVDCAIDCLAVAHALPLIASTVRADFWWSLLERLEQAVSAVQPWSIDSAQPGSAGLAHQLLTAELPLTLAGLFPEMRPLEKMGLVAHQALFEGLSNLTNGEGLIRGNYLSVQRPLLACWTRCRRWSLQSEQVDWDEEVELQYQWAITHSLAMSSSTGAALLGAPHDQPWTNDFLRNVLEVGADNLDAAAAASLFKKKLLEGIQVKKKHKVPESAYHCDWAELAYMRPEWERTDPALVVDYSGPDLRIECWNGTQRLLSGTWSWETTLDGKRLEPVGAWEEVCWFSDEDADYLELSIDLPGGASLERQIMLAREDAFLLLSDNIMDTAGGNIEHRTQLPLDGNVTFTPEPETREGRLAAGDKSVARVLPLALPEWRSDPRFGQLSAGEGGLELTMSRSGKSLACPLFIDLSKSRLKKECTWRQLAVAHALELAPHDVAVGYRMQCGKDQWILYRSLAEPASRTLLGQNLTSECLVARFYPPEGEIEELLEIDGDS